MSLRDLIITNRSYRRFYQDERLTSEQLISWIDLARLSPSAMNRQPLKYQVVVDKDTCGQIFPLLSWAGYLKVWDGPAEGERPAAYIIIYGDTKIRPDFGIDPGIAAQSILLGAVEAGYGGCTIASIRREELSKVLRPPDHLQILYVLALGKPKEKVELEEVNAAGDIKYYRDENQIHHVPKRTLKEIIL